MKRHTLYMCPVCHGKGGRRDYWGEYDECPGCEEEFPEWMDRTPEPIRGMATLTMMGISNPKRPFTHKGKPNRRYWKREYLKAMDEQRFFAKEDDWLCYGNVRSQANFVRREYRKHLAARAA